MTEEEGGRNERTRCEGQTEGAKESLCGATVHEGVTERVQRAYKQHNIQLFCKTGYTIRNAIICLKDPLDLEEKCGVVYECKSEQCGHLYVGEMERSLGEISQEHYKSLKEDDSKLGPQSASGEDRTHGN